MHNIVYTSLLKPFKNRPDNEVNEMDDEEEDLFYNVENIMNSKRFGRVIKYRVCWKGYDKTDDTWSPFENVKQVINLIKSFTARNLELYEILQ